MPSRPTEYDRAELDAMLIIFNKEKEVGTPEAPETKYVPVTVRANVRAFTTEGAMRPVSAEVEYGGERDAPVDAHVIYTCLPPELKAPLREVYLEAIDEDVA